MFGVQLQLARFASGNAVGVFVVKLTRHRGRAAPLGQRTHFQMVFQLIQPQLQLVARLERARRLGPFAVQPHMARVNGALRQQGNTGMMLFPIPFLISFLSRHYGLTAGDLIYTGTPEGVARLVSGDQLELALQGHTRARFTVA